MVKKDGEEETGKIEKWIERKKKDFSRLTSFFIYFYIFRLITRVNGCTV